MDVYLGMIAMFGLNFAPRGWILCNGQLLSIAQNSALFSLLSTTYGGDGVSTFGLPNLQGRVPIRMGNGSGLTPRIQGEMSGTENVTLLSTQMPVHTHSMTASGDSLTKTIAQGASMASLGRGGNTIPIVYVNGVTTPVDMASGTTAAGGNQAHNNMQPYLAMNYCIALQGIYPSRD